MTAKKRILIAKNEVCDDACKPFFTPEKAKRKEKKSAKSLSDAFLRKSNIRHERCIKSSSYVKFLKRVLTTSALSYIIII